MRTLTNFIHTVQSLDLRKYLDYYAGEKPGGLLLDGDSNDIQYRRFTVFELDHVFQMDAKLIMPIFLFLFKEIEKRLDATVEGRHNPPSLLVIDEAWFLEMGQGDKSPCGVWGGAPKVLDPKALVPEKEVSV
jgi:type IV secretory pathway VirB4 component